MKSEFTNIIVLEQKNFIAKVYRIMSFGLFLKAIFSFLVSRNSMRMSLIFGNLFIYFGLFIL